MPQWRTSNFRKSFLLLSANINFALALCEFQKNNCMILLAKNSEKKVNDYRLQLSRY
jgi:hypothetical protein